MAITTVNLDDDLAEWAAENHAALGYRSRSEMVNALLAEARADAQDDAQEVPQ